MNSSQGLGAMDLWLFAKVICKILFLLYPTVTVAENPLSNSEFQQRLTACAVSRNISIEADIIGSITDLYDGHRVLGTAELRNESNFLESFPESQKLLAYELYLECIKNLISPATDFRQGCMDGSISECSRMLDQLRLVSNYCGSFSVEFQSYELKFERLKRVNESLEASPTQLMQDLRNEIIEEMESDYATFGKKYSACRDASEAIENVSAAIDRAEELCKSSVRNGSTRCEASKQELVAFLGQVQRLTEESGYIAGQ